MLNSAVLAESAKRLEAALWATHKLRVLKPTELQLEAYMMKAYQRMERRFYDAFEQNVQAPIAEAEMTASDWLDSLAFERELYYGTFDAAAARALLAGHSWILAEMGLPAAFRLPFPNAQTYLANYGAQQVTKISDSTRRELRDVLYRSRVQGWAYDKLAKILREKWEQFRTPQPQQHIRSRAHLIAVTETANAYEWGNQIARQEVAATGLQVEKSWLVVGDDRTCMICMGNSMASWLPNQAAFPSGHERAPGHPACRCTIVTRVDVPLT